MHTSQLRALAREHTLGRLGDEEYVRRRRELIDDIVAGRVDIERQAPPAPRSREIASLPQALQRSPAHVAVGAVVVAAAILWALYPTRDPVSTPDGARGRAPSARVSDAREDPARVLVESFLAEGDWSEESLARFESTWNALTPNQRAEARSAAWFHRFVDGLRGEINAYKALAEFDDTGASAAAGKRLVLFGELLGVATELPEIGAYAGRPDGEAGGSPSAAPPAADRRPAASAWLDAQDEDAFTLQLFALSRADEAQRLVEAYPHLDLALLVFQADEPPYRVVYGSFPSEDAARSAHRQLPEALLEGEPRPFVRSIRELRDARREQASARR